MAYGLSATEAAAIAMAAVSAFAQPAWAFTRHLATLVHEGGHAAMAVLTRRRLSGIRLHSDTSGLTTSVGRTAGPGMIATAAAGYLAVPLVGLGLVASSRGALASLTLWIILAALLFMVLFIRNWFGVAIVALAAAAVALLGNFGSGAVQDFALLTLGWFLLFAGLRTTFDLGRYRRSNRSRTSDADVLARLTSVPAVVWNGVFVAAAVAEIVLAAQLVTGVRLIG